LNTQIQVLSGFLHDGNDLIAADCCQLMNMNYWQIKFL